MISTFSYMPAMCIFSRVFAFAFFSQDPFAPYPQGGGKPAPFSNTQAEDFLPPPRESIKIEFRYPYAARLGQKKNWHKIFLKSGQICQK